MKKKEAQEYLANHFDIYKPLYPSTEIVFCSHGDHTNLKGTSKESIDKVEGLELNYLGPHGHDLQGGLQSPFEIGGGLQNYLKANNGKEKDAGQWYNYELTSFTNAYEKKQNEPLEYQRIANQCGANTMKLKEGETSTTEAMLNALNAAGYTKVTAIHCRGENGMNSPEYFPFPGNNPNDMIAEKETTVSMSRRSSSPSSTRISNKNSSARKVSARNGIRR